MCVQRQVVQASAFFRKSGLSALNPSKTKEAHQHFVRVARTVRTTATVNPTGSQRVEPNSRAFGAFGALEATDAFLHRALAEGVVDFVPLGVIGHGLRKAR